MLLTSQRIGVLGKGGTGKSTVTVLLAHELRDAGYPIREDPRIREDWLRGEPLRARARELAARLEEAVEAASHGRAPSMTRTWDAEAGV